MLHLPLSYLEHWRRSRLRRGERCAGSHPLNLGMDMLSRMTRDIHSESGRICFWFRQLFAARLLHEHSRGRVRPQSEEAFRRNKLDIMSTASVGAFIEMLAAGRADFSPIRLTKIKRWCRIVRLQQNTWRQTDETLIFYVQRPLPFCGLGCQIFRVAERRRNTNSAAGARCGQRRVSRNCIDFGLY